MRTIMYEGSHELASIRTLTDCNFYCFSLFVHVFRTCVYRNENVGEQYWRQMQYVEPCPRFAHQLVYDERKKVFFAISSLYSRIEANCALHEKCGLVKSYYDVFTNCSTTNA